MLRKHSHALRVTAIIGCLCNDLSWRLEEIKMKDLRLPDAATDCFKWVHTLVDKGQNQNFSWSRMVAA